VQLLERAANLDQLDTLLSEASAGKGRLVLLGGEAGVGKTALVHHFCRLVARSVRILEGACDALSTPRPLGPLADIATTIGGELERQMETDGRRDDVFGALMVELSRGPKTTVMVFEDVH
jgi:predicted ATPase